MSLPERPFEAPWQAQLFALTVHLSERGLFTWPEWVAAFGPRVTDAPPEAYYDRWLEALEALLVERGVAPPETLADLAGAWARAARATPHGRPIALANDPGPGH